jgi:hypothetical protein
VGILIHRDEGDKRDPVRPWGDWGDKAHRDKPRESLFTGMKGMKGIL